MKSYIEEVTQRHQHPRYTRYTLLLFEYDAVLMDRERLEMIYNGLRLIQRALEGHTEEPSKAPAS